MFKILNIFLSQYVRINYLRHQKYKNKQLNNTRVLKVKNRTLELENYFKLISLPANDMDNFEKKRTNK